MRRMSFIIAALYAENNECICGKDQTGQHLAGMMQA